ncbi:carboxymuconolactone decarboxylase family protein [Roseicitreum antarcticum]|uniref:carboxymuconolactone decarboxylase family protein n=1 Tax=Roseicitreum antarcticum TaxID=564137 RepID=UPI001C40A1C7|nr:carboxymuconolactone decarboxylase family protein [Roseicitreum antarcticum]
MITTAEGLSAAQRAVYSSIAGGARGGVRGPHAVLLHSPGAAAPMDRLGAFVRYECSVPERQRELAILVIAALWRADYEWYAHAPLARKQGLSDAVIAAVGQRETPNFETALDTAVHRFVRELLDLHRVEDSTYAEAVSLLSEVGTVDLVALVGYYSAIAMTLNTFEVGVPADAALPW